MSRVSFKVIGGGLMGRLVALGLRRQGHDVALYDQGGPEGRTAAAHVAAAMLAPYAESVDAEPEVVRLGIESLSLWPDLLESLARPVFFQEEGTLVVWHRSDRDQAVQFRQRLDRLRGQVSEAVAPQNLDRDGIGRLEPELFDRFQDGIFLPAEAQLDNRSLLQSLAETLLAEGVALHWETTVDPDEFSGEWVIDCRGMGAKPDWRSLRGVRGEVVRVETREVTLRRPVRLLHPRYPLYIAPKPEGVFVIGATQIESEDYSPASVRSALELLSALYSVHPGFGEARILEIVSQCRPALPDNAPRIERTGFRRIRINGLYRHGYLMAPALMQATLAFVEASLSHPESLDTWCSASPWPHLYHLDAA